MRRPQCCNCAAANLGYPQNGLFNVYIQKIRDMNQRLLLKIALTLCSSLFCLGFAHAEQDQSEICGDCTSYAKRRPTPIAHDHSLLTPGSSFGYGGAGEFDRGALTGSGAPVGAPKVSRPVAPPSSDKNSHKTNCEDSGGGPNNISPATGMPVIIATGEKVKDEVDFQGGGLYPLGLTRHYHGFSTQFGTLFGSKWASSYDYHLIFSGSDCASPVPVTGPACFPHTITFNTPDGSFTYAKATTRTVYSAYRVAKSEAMGELTTDDPTIGWNLTIGSTSYDFDANGNILDIADASGVIQTFQYSAI